MNNISQELINKIKTQGQGDRTTQYQSLGDLKGRRDIQHRCKIMKLPSDFGKRTVLDIGCNLGAMCIEAAKRNAGRVVGIDCHQKTIDIAKEYASAIGFSNIEYYVYNIDNGLAPLQKIIGNDKFDVLFVLSVLNNIKRSSLNDIIKYYCGSSLYLEGHSKQTKKELIKYLERKFDFDNIHYLGNTTDKYTRANFLATKSPVK